MIIVTETSAKRRIFKVRYA